ncbi:MAG: hypothetical protein RL173_290 [Fibrobacterota bacterium]|jgi:inward rectifier potassium channel
MLARLFQTSRNRPDFDPGLGTKVVNRHTRLILPDGSFNVRRIGIAWWKRATPYQWLGQISWTRFTLLAFGGYVAANTVFALAYLGIGVEHLRGVEPGPWGYDFMEAWFFSAQTLTTVGYGHVSPSGTLASSIAAFEALFGLMGFGVWTGLLFNRFSRARSRILFSRNAVVAPHKGATAWMFRMVASHDHPLLDAEAYALFSWVGEGATGPVRHYQDLSLERSSVRFFPMNWTVVHPIDDESPLKDLSKEDLEQVDAEILVLVRAHDETYGQGIHARSSWKASDILFGSRFSSMMTPGDDGATVIDLANLDTTEPVTPAP